MLSSFIQQVALKTQTGVSILGFELEISTWLLMPEILLSHFL